MKAFKKQWVAAAMAAVFTTMNVMPMAAQAETVPERPTGLAMAGDVVLARPLLFVGTVIGTALFIVSSPFSLLGGNIGEAGKTLVVTPAKATFVRCLGCTMKHLPQDD
ncbi:MAG TPA: hypothetical protein VFM46_19115 [Pseudomonadales bacterium]|nr:hypothetical protein [Pseudomonadales bacterium]